MAAPIQAVVDQQRITLHPNKKENPPRSIMQRLSDSMDTANTGPFRLGQLGDRFFKLMHLVTQNEGCKNVSTMFNKAWTVTIIPRLFSVNYGAYKAVKELETPNDNEAVRTHQYVEVVHDVTDAMSAWGYASSLFLACFKRTAELSMSVLKGTEIVTFVHDITDGGLNGQAWNKARVAADKASLIAGGPEIEAVQQSLLETQRYHFAKTCKSVCSVAGFVLGLAVAASGLTLPGLAIAAASISLSGTILAMGAELYKESMANAPVKFFDERHVVELARG